MKPSAAGTDAFTWSRTARPPTSFVGNPGAGTNGLWTATPSYRWSQNPAGTAASYVTEPLTADTAVVGAGALEAWIKSAARSVDLQATVTEVRPDGQETFVQSGWLRASERKLDAKRSTLLEPVLSLRKKDSARLPKGKFARVTVPLYYQGHVYRAGSRVRVSLAAPRGDKPDLGVPRDPAAQQHEGDGRARGLAPVAARAAGGRRDRRADARCRRARRCAASPAGRTSRRLGRAPARGGVERVGGGRVRLDPPHALAREREQEVDRRRLAAVVVGG